MKEEDPISPRGLLSSWRHPHLPAAKGPLVPTERFLPWGPDSSSQQWAVFPEGRPPSCVQKPLVQEMGSAGSTGLEAWG